jgi:cytochrome P450
MSGPEVYRRLRARGAGAARVPLPRLIPPLRPEEPPVISEDTAIDLLPFRDLDYRADPYPYYARLRERHPVYRHPSGVYVVTRYADVARLIRDPTLSVRQLDFGAAEPLHQTMLGQDVPDHTRLRRLTNQWFTPQAVDRWSMVMRRSVETVLDEVVRGDGTLEVAGDLALRCTFETICHIFGIDATEMLQVQEKTYEIGLCLGPGGDDEDARTARGAFAWFDGHIRGILALKRERPGDGMIDALVAAHADGKLSEDELIQTIFLFFAVGHLDVKHLITHGVWLMARQSELWEVYRGQPEARPGIIEEILRYDTPEQMVARLTTQPTRIGDTTVPAGEVLLLMIAAANRDPEIFPDPDRFDHTRPVTAGRHLAFGAGQHGCAGQVLARAEAEVVLTCLVNRFGSVEMAGAPTFAHTEFLRTITRLPVRFR